MFFFVVVVVVLNFMFSSVQSLSRVRLFAIPWIAARQASLSITNSWSSLRLTSIASVMPFSHLILCRPLYLLPPIPPSIRVFSNESTLRMRWPKYWSFSFSSIPSKENPGLISFRMDWLDLLAVQGTLKSLLQHHSSKASILRHSAFFTTKIITMVWSLTFPTTHEKTLHMDITRWSSLRSEWLYSLQPKMEKLYQREISCSVVSNSLRPHESQHTRAPCPSPSPGVHSNSRPSSQSSKITSFFFFLIVGYLF